MLLLPDLLVVRLHLENQFLPHPLTRTEETSIMLDELRVFSSFLMSLDFGDYLRIHTAL